MMRGQNLLIIGFVIALLLLFTFYEANQPQPVDWSMNFSVDKKGPYGTYIMRDALPYMFPDGKVTVSQIPLEAKLSGNNTKFPEGYFFVNGYYRVYFEELNALRDYVSKGNSLFVSAEKIHDVFLATLGVKKMKRVAHGENYIRGFDNRGYKFREDQVYFELYDYFQGEVLGYVDTIGKPNFIRVPWGAGSFYVHTNPLAFTNISLLDSLNGDYYQKVLSFLPPNLNVVWDESQKNKLEEQKTPFRVLLQYPALRWAYLLLLVGGVLYVLFRSKREQRVIPVIRPPENRTLEFVSVVSSLYYRNRDHVGIARKRVDYFLEEVRYFYKLRTDDLNDEFVELLAERSGVPAEKVTRLVEIMVMVRKAVYVSEEQLLELVKYIELFKTKR